MNYRNYRKKRYYFIYFSVIALLLSNALFAQSNRIIGVRHFDIKDGLTQNTVSAFEFDETGFLWVGTQEGLDRFDGKNFTNINKLYGSNQSMVFHAEITSIKNIPNHKIAIGTRNNGIFIYSSLLQTIPPKKIQFQKSSHNIKQIVKMEYNERRELLFILDKKGDLHYTSLHDSTMKMMLLEKGVTDFSIDNKETLFVIKSELINIYSLTSLIISSSNSVRINFKVVSMCKARLNGIYLAAKTGSIYYLGNNSNNDSPILDLVMETRLKGITAIQKIDSSFLVGTEYSLFRFSVDKRIKLNLLAGEQLIKNIFITNIKIDKYKNIWLGTYQKGLFLFSQNVFNFNSISEGKNGITSNSVVSLYQDSRGSVWAGSWLGAGGISKIDLSKKRIQHYLSGKKDNNYKIFSISELSTGEILFGSWGDGLLKFNAVTNKITKYGLFDINGMPLNLSVILSIEEDKQGRLWLGTLKRGIFVFKNHHQQFRLNSGEKAKYKINGNTIHKIYYDRKSVIWIGTANNGLFSYDLLSDKIKSYNEKINNIQIHNEILSINSDLNDNILVGTSKGLYILQISGGKTSVKHPSFLSGFSVYGSVVDNRGKYWLSTNKGIIFFDNKDGYSYLFDKTDGILSDEFIQGAYLKSTDGRIFFSNLQGVLYFNPDKIIIPENPSSVRFSNFQIYNENKPLKSIIKENNITVSYKDKLIKLDYFYPDLLLAEKITNYYRIRGLYNKWVNSNGLNSVYLNGLQGGKFMLEIKSNLIDNNKFSNKAALHIIVEPPFWETNIFRISSAAFIILIMTISYKRKIKSIKRKEAEKREKERIESEINTARETQMNLLPNNDFETSFLKIWANCKPAFEVGGDYYDYFLFGEDNLKLFLTTVDISGKSMQAAVSVALVAGMTANFRNYKEISPGKFLSNLNLAFRSKRPTKRQFAAMTAAVFDFNDMRLIYSNSGQPDIFYLRDGKISYLEPNKMRIPVGAMSDIQYDENSHDMMSGDIYLFISDGVIEAMDVKKRMFGYERINDILKSNSTLVEEIGLKISDKVSKFSAGTIQYDDYTIILLQIL